MSTWRTLLVLRCEVVVLATTCIFGPRNIHDLVKRPPTVILPDRVTFLVAHMIVCRNEDADRVRRFWPLAVKLRKQADKTYL